MKILAYFQSIWRKISPFAVPFIISFLVVIVQVLCSSGPVEVEPTPSVPFYDELPPAPAPPLHPKPTAMTNLANFVSLCIVFPLCVSYWALVIFIVRMFGSILYNNFCIYDNIMPKGRAGALFLRGGARFYGIPTLYMWATVVGMVVLVVWVSNPFPVAWVFGFFALLVLNGLMLSFLYIPLAIIVARYLPTTHELAWRLAAELSTRISYMACRRGDAPLWWRQQSRTLFLFLAMLPLWFVLVGGQIYGFAYLASFFCPSQSAAAAYTAASLPMWGGEDLVQAFTFRGVEKFVRLFFSMIIDNWFVSFSTTLSFALYLVTLHVVLGRYPKGALMADISYFVTGIAYAVDQLEIVANPVFASQFPILVMYGWLFLAARVALDPLFMLSGGSKVTLGGPRIGVVKPVELEEGFCNPKFYDDPKEQEKITNIPDPYEPGKKP